MQITLKITQEIDKTTTKAGTVKQWKIIKTPRSRQHKITCQLWCECETHTVTYSHKHTHTHTHTQRLKCKLSKLAAWANYRCIRGALRHVWESIELKGHRRISQASALATFKTTHAHTHTHTTAHSLTHKTMQFIEPINRALKKVTKQVC